MTMTPSPEALRDLANRCESEQPSRLLDAEIAVALRLRPVGKLNAWIDENFPVWRAREDGRAQVVDATGDDGVHWEVVSYTGSLDAAVTLVPADAWRETNGPREYLNIPLQSPNYWQCVVTVWDQTTDDFIGWGATEPMAICSAALRARAAIAEERNDAVPTRSDSTTVSEG